jgi:hypothetical protein
VGRELIRVKLNGGHSGSIAVYNVEDARKYGNSTIPKNYCV